MLKSNEHFFYSIGKNETWKLIIKIKISLVENAKSVFVLSRAPMDITCSDKSANEYLANGDAFFGDCMVYSKKHLNIIVSSKLNV